LPGVIAGSGICALEWAVKEEIRKGERTTGGKKKPRWSILGETTGVYEANLPLRDLTVTHGEKRVN
jgi:hypothetical protein